MFQYDWKHYAPESLGISSKHISNFIASLENYGIFAHSFLIMRHGKVAAEAYYAPFQKDDLQRLYSSSKTFSAIAIGLLQDEGKLSLDDPIWKFFPEYDPETLYPETRRATIRDTLIMAMPFSGCTYSVTKDGNWIDSYFKVKPDHREGLIWNYNTTAAQLFAEITKRLTGMPFQQYLHQRVGEEQFMKTATCVTVPDGSEFAGSGLLCTLRDFALGAELMCSGGKLAGRQILSEQFVKEATTSQICNNVDGYSTFSSEGYGYQIWCGKDCFMFKGNGVQFAICYPKYNLTLAITDNARGNPMGYSRVFYSFLREIVEKISDEPLAPDPQAHAQLQHTIDNLECIRLPGDAHSDWEAKINGVSYELDENRTGFTGFRVDYDAQGGVLTLEDANGIREIRFGCAQNRKDLFRETQKGNAFIGEPFQDAYTCYSCGMWVEPNKLRIKTDFYGTFCGLLMITIAFRGDEVAMHLHRNIDFFADDWFLKRYEGYLGGRKKNS